MARIISLVNFFFLVTLFAPLIAKRCPLKYKQRTLQLINNELKGDSVVIFIHGTVIPLISPLNYRTTQQRGLIPFIHCARRDQIIAETLTKTSPQEYQTHQFFVYGWCGVLSFAERRKAAEDLYKHLRSYKGSITIIGHSHGASVALYLAQIALEDKNYQFSIDRLILFAPPVQSVTAHHIKAPIFKKVFSFYSSADLGQVADPQGLYDDTKKISINKAYFLFSQRTFAPSQNLIQVRVLLNMQSPGHSDFLIPRFLSRLPATISFLESSAALTRKKDFILNIPRPHEKVHLVKKKHLSGSYIPRTVRTCRCAKKYHCFS
ncbi:hypothetical protein H0X06_02900 [Candidatus Dependentiae bacterium]|nr:hypothetical protein [Candidatus Dependentiae bacterium]